MNDFGIAERSGGLQAATKTRRDPYLAFALRWWWLLLAGAILGLAGAIGYIRFGPVPYSSMALVIVNSQTDVSVDSMGTPSKLRAGAEAYAGQMASAPVYIQVSKRFPGPGSVTPAELQDWVQQKKITIAAQKSTNLIGVTVIDDDPAFSRALADTFAGVFVDHVNDQAKTELTERRDELQRQIDHTNQQLTAAQLHQRGEDLQKELQGHRAMLLQLQMQYQQEIERQITADRLQQLAANQGGADAAAPTDQTEEAQAQVLAAIRDQQANEQQIVEAADQQVEQARRDAEATIAELTNQLARTRGELASVNAQIEAASGAVVVESAEAPEGVPLQQQIFDMQGRLAGLQQARREAEAAGRQQQTQRAQLQSREQSLMSQFQSQRTAAQDIDGQIQQERQRQVQVRQQAAMGPSPTSGMTREQRRALEQQREAARQAAQSQMSLSDGTIQMLQQRKAEADRQAASILSQISQVRESLAQLPPEGEADATANQLQREATDLEQQIRVLQQQHSDLKATSQVAQGQRASLIQREQDLQRQILDARTQMNERTQALAADAQQRRGRVLALQTQYQNEVSRQTEADRRQADAAQREAASAAGSASVTTNPQLAQARSQLHTQWLDVISNQIRDVQANIDTTTKQLAGVRETQQQYPAESNAAVASMFVGAYTNMMQSLTRDLVRLQLNEQNAGAPIYRYGEASEPVRRLSLRRAVAFGVGAGIGMALALAYLLHLLMDGQRKVLPGVLFGERRRVLPGAALMAGDSDKPHTPNGWSSRERLAAVRGRTLLAELSRDGAAR